MKFRSSTLFASYIGISLLLLAVLVIDAGRRNRDRVHERAERRALVKALDLTDLVLFTDARYTRHPAMADRHSPFQDHPLAQEHFPSGSLVLPPQHLRSYGSH